MTDSRMRTMRAVPVLACAIGLAAVLMGCCVALGYHLAQASTQPTVGQALGIRSFDFKRPEGRALVDHVGALSGRLTRLEIEAKRATDLVGAAHRYTAKDLVSIGSSEGVPTPTDITVLEERGDRAIVEVVSPAGRSRMELINGHGRWRIHLPHYGNL